MAFAIYSVLNGGCFLQNCCVKILNFGFSAIQKHSVKIRTTVGGLLDGVPPNNKTLIIKAAHSRGLFRIQAHGYHSLRALLINPAREA